MLDEYGFEIYEENQFPCAYLLTFRTFGTWLHGDDRSSVGRSHNKYGEPKIQPSVPLTESMSEKMVQRPFILDPEMRKLVAEAIEEVCQYRNYGLNGMNVRTNHLHSVISAAVKPKKIVNDLKVYSTRKLREHLLIGQATKVWSRGASKRYLWKPRYVETALDYVLYCQEDVPFEFRERY